MLQDTFAYWKPGELRKLRVFMSHRYGKDQQLFDLVFAQLRVMGFHVQDTSLVERQALKGPKGGLVDDLDLLREIAARIFTSDILVAPSRVGSSKSGWIQWEVQLAAVCYSLPVLFIDHSTNMKRKTQLVSSVQDAGGRCAVCGPDRFEIAQKIVSLVDPRVHKTMVGKPDALEVYRGPVTDALHGVLAKLPFEAVPHPPAGESRCRERALAALTPDPPPVPRVATTQRTRERDRQRGRGNWPPRPTNRPSYGDYPSYLDTRSLYRKVRRWQFFFANGDLDMLKTPLGHNI